MSVKLEKFSLLKSPLQGLLVHGLVMAEGGWLGSVYPGTVERYRDIRHSVKNVGRIATNNGMNAYMVRKNRAVVGLATIIFEQSVVHPEEGERWGNNLDYWLMQGTEESVHIDTASKLLDENNKQDTKRRGEYPVIVNPGLGSVDMAKNETGGHPIFGTIDPSIPNPPIGLTTIMSRFGTVASLSTPDHQDPFGITGNGVPLQMYEFQTY